MSRGSTYVLVPVRLTNGTFGKMLLSSGNVMALGKVLNDLGTKPTSRVDSRLGIGESPLQVRHETTIGILLAQVIGILLVDVFVGATYTRRVNLIIGSSKKPKGDEHTSDRSSLAVANWLAILELIFGIISFNGLSPRKSRDTSCKEQESLKKLNHCESRSKRQGTGNEGRGTQRLGTRQG